MTDLITRHAPQWAWDIIDETLALDSESGAFDSDLRNDISRAVSAMLDQEDVEAMAVEAADKVERREVMHRMLSALEHANSEREREEARHDILNLWSRR